jgi:hypothetical protein
MSIFPTDEGMIFMLCDDFRNEGNGKISMFGLLGDNVLVDQPLGQEKVVLQSLGVYIAFRDGMGNFQMSIGLTAPDKTTFPTKAAQQTEKKPEGWMNIAFKMMPFQGALGNYTLKITLEDEAGTKREYTRTFSIQRQPVVPAN